MVNVNKMDHDYYFFIIIIISSSSSSSSNLFNVDK